MDFPQRAVFFLEEDSSLPAHSKPLMLEAVLFCPILKWHRACTISALLPPHSSLLMRFFLLTEVKDGAGHQHNGQMDARRQEKLR